MKVTLSLTHRCNLACDYCYAGRAHPSDMSAATGRRIIDFVLALHSPGQPLRVHFFGGEPLLCLDVMREIAAYLSHKAAMLGVPYTLAITTNGTLLSDDALRFLRDQHVELCISVDGPAFIHNRHRCYKSGRGSHALIMANLQRTLPILDNVQLNAVYSPDTVKYLADSVRYLIDQGARIIHLNPDITAAWSPESLQLLGDAFTEVGRVYIECYEGGHEIAIAPIDSKIVLFLKGGYSFEDMCCMGTGELAFAPSGNIYPCERFIGEDQDPRFRIGTVDAGFDLAQRDFVAQHRANHNDECRGCCFRPYCMNWCGCTNCAMTGRSDLVGPAMCANERAVIGAAQHVLTTLSERHNALFLDHLLQYVHDKPACIRSNAKGV